MIHVFFSGLLFFWLIFVVVCNYPNGGIIRRDATRSTTTGIPVTTTIVPTISTTSVIQSMTTSTTSTGAPVTTTIVCTTSTISVIQSMTTSMASTASYVFLAFQYFYSTLFCSTY
jgi:hypothetical protein